MRWSKPGVPHKGWQDLGIFDLRDEQAPELSKYLTCEMCGQKGIRFMHEMTHPDCEVAVYVGRYCADKMAEPYKD